MPSPGVLRGVKLDAVAADRPEARDVGLSFADLYRAQYGPMVRLAHLLTGSNSVAEELVQDAFVRVHGKWDQIDAPGAYLRTAVVNACRSHHRRRVLERTRRPQLTGEATAPAHDELWDALARLSYRQRACWSSSSTRTWRSATSPPPSGAGPER